MPWLRRKNKKDEMPTADSELRVVIRDIRNNSRSLTGVDLRRKGIDKGGAATLAKGLRKNTFVTGLNLDENTIGRDGAVALAGALCHNSSVTSLRLVRNRISVDGARAVADMLRVNKTLEQLALGLNDIHEDGAVAVADALQKNGTLKSLGLKVNMIGDKGAVAVADALKYNKSLTSLGLKGNGIGWKGARSVAEALCYNTTLTKLCLSENALGDEGAKSVAFALQCNGTLTRLDMWSNHIGWEGATAVAEALRNNDSLVNLFLQDNCMGDDGAEAIANALCDNTTLTKINLNRNRIGNDGAIALAGCLCNNHSLLELDIQANCFSEEGVKALARAIRYNQTLGTLGLWDNSVGEGAKMLSEALFYNHTLTVILIDSNRFSRRIERLIEINMASATSEEAFHKKSLEFGHHEEYIDMVPATSNETIQEESAEFGPFGASDMLHQAGHQQEQPWAESLMAFQQACQQQFLRPAELSDLGGKSKYTHSKPQELDASKAETALAVQPHAEMKGRSTSAVPLSELATSSKPEQDILFIPEITPSNNLAVPSCAPSRDDTQQSDRLTRQEWEWMNTTALHQILHDTTHHDTKPRSEGEGPSALQDLSPQNIKSYDSPNVRYVSPMSSQEMTGAIRSPASQSIPMIPPHEATLPHPPSTMVENLTTKMREGMALSQTGSAQVSDTLRRREDDLCLICEEKQKTVLLLPCKHLCLCPKCAQHKELVNCPICRSNIKDSMVVFV